MSNRDRLAAHGYLYPEIGCGTNQTGQHFLAHHWSGGWLQKEARNQDTQALWDEFLALVRSTEKNIVISSERFFGASHYDHPALPSEMRALLSSTPAKIIVYLRSQENQLYSTWNQFVKRIHGFTTSLPDFVSERGHKFDYGQILDRWEGAFGLENIIVRPLNPDQLIGGGLLSDFLAILHLDRNTDFKNVEDKQENISLPYSVAEVLRRLKPYLTTDQFHRVTNFILCSGVMEHPPSELEKTRKRRVAKQIALISRESNRRIARRYLGTAELFPQVNIEGEAEAENETFEDGLDTALVGAITALITRAFPSEKQDQ